MKEEKDLTRTTIVSCPGKVLISGGYLVLDRNFNGMVISTASRFFTIVKSNVNKNGTKNEKFEEINLLIRSPQFTHAEWSYQIRIKDEIHFNSNQSLLSGENKFIELAVRESFKLSLALRNLNQNKIQQKDEQDNTKMNQFNSKDVTIDILGDNDFYSQPRQNDNNVEILPFNKMKMKLEHLHKTGLGSSAAMVTSLCSAILLHFTPTLNPNENVTKLLLHNLSQYVHSLAQGKVGSGFDVSAALWGTHVYKRFSPSCLSHLLNPETDQNNITSFELGQILDPRVNLTWTDPSTAPIIEQFSIPEYTTLILADVDAGSHTPSMVNQVLNWKNHQSQIANEIWNELSHKNEELKLSFKKLHQASLIHHQEYISTVSILSTDSNFHQRINNSPFSEYDSIEELFIKLSSITKSIRKLMKNMGIQSNVPIEPDSQTKLLDECEKLDGIIATGVPGAGGYDAIWLLVFNPPPNPNQPNLEESKIIKNLIHFLNNWSLSSIKVLSPNSWVNGGLKKSNVVHNQNQFLENDGIQIFHDLNLVDRLKYLPDLLS